MPVSPSSHLAASLGLLVRLPVPLAPVELLRGLLCPVLRGGVNSDGDLDGDVAWACDDERDGRVEREARRDLVMDGVARAEAAVSTLSSSRLFTALVMLLTHHPPPYIYKYITNQSL